MGAAQPGAVTAMRKIYVILSSLSLVMSVSQKTVCAESWQDAFSTHRYVGTGGQVLPYRLLKPEKIEPGQSYPLVLFLHGAGERGATMPCSSCTGRAPSPRRKIGGSTRVLSWPRNVRSTGAGSRSTGPCLRIRCPGNRRCRSGSPWSWSISWRPNCRQIERRFYITGLSMGGFGTWDATARWPRYFAAAVPICGGGDAAQAAKLRNLPIWAFHGDRDATVRPRRTTDMIDAIRKAGGTPKMTIYPGVEHDSWNRAYADPAVLDWLFAQKN